MSQAKRMFLKQAHPVGNKLIYELFVLQVERNPHAIAVSFKDQRLTYWELNQKVSQLAHHLRYLGVKPEVLVGIYLERSLDLVIAQLAIFKAGGAYLPLDSTYPKERLAFMLEDAQVSLLLAQHHLLANLPEHKIDIVCLDDDWNAIAQASQDNFSSLGRPDNLAYVIYTSGSTGTPKGVMIEQRSLVNFTQAAIEAYEIQPGDRLLQFASVGFDTAIEEIFPTLLAGATLILRTEDMLCSVAAFLDRCRELEITVLDLPTSFWHQICADLEKGRAIFPESIRLVIVGGERALPKWLNVWNRHIDRRVRLVNGYGPTEGTVVTTLCDIGGLNAVDNTGHVLPIGKAIKNVSVYVLDESRQFTPLGEAGELYIGGIGLARGYLNRPDLTAQHFIPNPFQDGNFRPGELQSDRLYKTGDKVRFRQDGHLEYLGRVDQQEKIRGFRVELAEIEAALEEHPIVQEAIVTVQEETIGNKRLIAYVVQRSPEIDLNDAVSYQHLEAQQLSQWQTIHNEDRFNLTAEHWEPTFNISGWNSSYTGCPISDAEMHEWVNNTVARILSLNPRRVLEIGCGTGLILFPIAPHCVQYHGTDFSSVALQYVQAQISKQPLKYSQVSLAQRDADDFSEIEPCSFDTVILNSVIQYFPSINYLLRVLMEAVQVVEPGGHIFIGDVRSAALLEIFYLAVELHQSPPSLSTQSLQHRLSKRLQMEEELAVDPAFFFALQRQFPAISNVCIQLKQGHYTNELNQFRYDVVLQVGPQSRTLVRPIRMNWQDQALSLSTLRQLLLDTQPDILEITQVPNARVLPLANALEWLQNSDPTQTIEALQIKLENLSDNSGIDPEDFWSLGQELFYKVNVSWSLYRRDGAYDVLLCRQSTSTSDTLPLAIELSSTQLADLKHLQTYANNPLYCKASQKLVPELHSFLKQKLPSYMVPSAFVILDYFPLNTNGKIDRRALPVPTSNRPYLTTAYVPPSTPLEQQLVKIWSEVLSIDRIGIHDNFFELGGHSLLTTQMIALIEEVCNQMISLFSFLQAPTVAGLVEIIQTVQQPHAEIKINGMDLETLNAASVLDEAIVPGSAALPAVTAPQSIFLTGSTGFLGAFLLQELLQRTSSKIYCLVRSFNPKTAREKIFSNLKRYLLYQEEMCSRIIPISGDLTKPKFGLSDQEFFQLAETIDVVYHNGACVNLFFPYSTLYQTNVFGTQEILRLACLKKIKPVHFISSLDVFESAISTGASVFKETDSINQGSGISNGYAQSKWIAERLVEKARDRGIPTYIYRPGMIAGHSKTGLANLDDLLCRLIKGFVQMGSAPYLDIKVDITPVDYVSQAIVYLSQQSSSHNTFHLVNPNSPHLSQLIHELQILGFSLREIDYKKWQIQLQKTAKYKEDYALGPLASILTERIYETQMTRLELWLAGEQLFNSQNTINALADSPIVCPTVNAELIKTYLSYMVGS